MLVSRILATLRRDLDDDPLNQSVRLWSDIELATYLDEGAEMFCRDTRVLKDSVTVGETLATATITLTGTAGQVDSVKVNDVTITSAAVPFDTDLATTATNLASNINAYTSSPNYTADASALDGSLIISAVAGTGSNPNEFDVVTTCSGGDLAADDTEMASGTSLCEMNLLADKHTYDLDSRVVQIESISASDRYPLTKRNVAWMDKHLPGWRYTSSGTPYIFITDYSKGKVRFYPTPDAAETLYPTISRTPLSSMLVDENTVNTDLDVELDNDDIVVVRFWARACAYQKEDAETLRPDKAAFYEQKYERGVTRRKNHILLAQDTDDVCTPHRGHL